MITYQYQAITKDGKKTRGVVQAIDEYAAVTKIKAACPIVTAIKPVRERGGDGILQKEIGVKKINAKALSIMCSQFAIILKSGVPISRCMEMIADQTEDKRLKKMLFSAAEDVAEGIGIARSFEKNCKGLPITFVETVRAGEESGTLEDSFEALQRYYEKSYRTGQKVRRAISYPIFVICVAIVVLIIVMVKVVPALVISFVDLGGDLPLITKALISSSEFFGRYWLIMVTVVVMVIAAVKLVGKNEEGKLYIHRLKLRLPILGNISLLNNSSQFANTMSTLLTAGISVHKALGVTAKVLDNYVLSREISMMSGRIEEGKSFGECMRATHDLPTTLVEMSAIGEETGELEETLSTVGDYFDNEAEHATEKAISKLEPTILVIMAGFAGFIVIAIYLPMFTMYSLI
ncbi:MAG: type II secretion system F family protein [Clostridiales bacterium]|nr:type II secretion system F family protein [Clostridiales bacterium]